MPYRLEESVNVAEVIPYRNLKEKMKLIRLETRKGRIVESDDFNIYSYLKEMFRYKK